MYLYRQLKKKQEQSEANNTLDYTESDAILLYMEVILNISQILANFNVIIDFFAADFQERKGEEKSHDVKQRLNLASTEK